jgi:hypothetical protein
MRDKIAVNTVQTHTLDVPAKNIVNPLLESAEGWTGLTFTSGSDPYGTVHATNATPNFYSTDGSIMPERVYEFKASIPTVTAPESGNHGLSLGLTSGTFPTLGMQRIISGLREAPLPMPVS